jgi:hypothetical protein
MNIKLIFIPLYFLNTRVLIPTIRQLKIKIILQDVQFTT